MPLFRAGTKPHQTLRTRVHLRNCRIHREPSRHESGSISLPKLPKTRKDSLDSTRRVGLFGSIASIALFISLRSTVLPLLRPVIFGVPVTREQLRQLKDGLAITETMQELKRQECCPEHLAPAS